MDLRQLVRQQFQHIMQDDTGNEIQDMKLFVVDDSALGNFAYVVTQTDFKLNNVAKQISANVLEGIPQCPYMACVLLMPASDNPVKHLTKKLQHETPWFKSVYLRFTT